MGFLDSWSRRATQRREGKVEFLGEQSGKVEDPLKRELILEFLARPDVQRAYLARVTFPPETESVVALCVVSSRPEDRSLVLRVGEILRRRSAHETPLEILFLTADQEAEVARISAPFYRSATST